jgi:hypothetical protein
MQIETWELHWKMQKLSGFPFAHFPSSVYAKSVKTFLDQQFPGKWIGRGGPIAWPPRSQELTPLDFFLWGNIKELVHRAKVQDVGQLRRWITAVCEPVTPMKLQNTLREAEYCSDICWATEGAHVGIYWGISKLENFLHLSVNFPCFCLY